MNLKHVRFYILVLASVVVYGCAAPRESVRIQTPEAKRGVYHKVQSKETLWRVAKAYNVPVEDLVRANNIPDAAHIQENQLLFIPDVGDKKQVVSVSEAFGNDDFKWPIKGKVISYFGDSKSLWVNNGIDIKSVAGQDVFPSRGGEVIFADYLNGYGQTIVIGHEGGYQTVYAKNSKLSVSSGDMVTSQTPIAVVGGDGALAFLHFEIRKDSQPKNPLHFLP